MYVCIYIPNTNVSLFLKLLDNALLLFIYTIALVLLSLSYLGAYILRRKF